MEKRIIAASIISVVLILAWGYFMPHPKQAPKQSAVAVKKQAAAVNPIVPAQPNESAAKKNLPSKSKNIVTISKSVQNIKNVSYKGEKIYVRFNKSAGAISSLNLLNYSYTEKNQKNKVNLGNSKNISQMINFIPKNAASSIKLTGIIKEKNSIKFVYNIDDKIILTKEYKFLSGKYLFANAVYIKNLTDKPVVFKGYFIVSAALKPAVSKNLDYINLSPVVYANKSLINPAIKETAQYNGDISFAGFNSKYFLFSAISPGTDISVKKKDKIISFIVPKKVLISPNKTANVSLKFYAGPKKLSLLTPLGHNLNSTLSFGFFGFFSIILLHILEFFYSFVHNYGLAIILLVLGIRIAFYPLTYTGFKSMKQMQKLTPKINDLRERYKDNKAELNKKIMELYKESRVNPFGGCLPMLLQIPVFYGLYMTLLMSIQLRNAPFIFWIHNLSVQDPYYILPILMGASMLISQKMNPMMGDPTQAKLMLILPIVFTFIFIHFPAGLLLYWTVNNILTIAQQYIINRKFA
ncbi:MAG: membrane protein insertase YidC [bacterium]